MSHESRGVLNDPNTHRLGKNFAVLASCSVELKIGCDHVVNKDIRVQVVQNMCYRVEYPLEMDI